MLRWIGGLCDRICAVIGAIICAQAPLFMQQYSQQLVGREAELHHQVEAMRQAASISGKTLEQFISKFLASGDIDIARQGELMQNLVDRWQALTKALSALQHSSVFERPFIFLGHLNVDTFKSTFYNYSIGLPLTLEGAVYAIIGIAIGYCIFAGIRQVGMRFSRMMFFWRAKSPKTLTS